MSSKLNPIDISNLGLYGVIRQSEVDDKLIPEGAVTEVQNFHFDRKGAATLRPGLTTLGATILTLTPAVGLHNAQSGTALAVFSNGSTSAIYSFNGSAWSMSLDGGTASVRIRFLDFGSYTIALNFFYNTYTSMRFWNAGSSRHWHVSGNPLNTDQMYGRACQLGEVFTSRIYLAGDTSKEGNSSRLYFSEVIATSGTVSWDKSVNFVDINPGDGEGITGLKRYSLQLLCFKPNYIYRFKSSGTDPDPLIKIGTRSNESIVEGKRGLYFHHDTGFYRYTGGYPEEISRPISDFVDAISYSQYSNIIGWKDTDHIYWSLGNLTISETTGNVSWKNVVIRFTESSEIWTIYSYSNDIRAGIDYNSGSTITRIVGTDHGVVATFNSGTTDFGEIIKYRIVTKWYNGGNTGEKKIANTIIGICEKSQEAVIMCQTDDNPEWNTIGQLRKYVNYYRNQGIKFHRIRFKVTGTSKSESLIFQGLKVEEGINEGLTEN